MFETIMMIFNLSLQNRRWPWYVYICSCIWQYKDTFQSGLMIVMSFCSVFI